jgi:hypothetical protein
MSKPGHKVAEGAQGVPRRGEKARPQGRPATCKQMRFSVLRFLPEDFARDHLIRQPAFSGVLLMDHTKFQDICVTAARASHTDASEQDGRCLLVDLDEEVDASIAMSIWPNANWHGRMGGARNCWRSTCERMWAIIHMHSRPVQLTRFFSATL